MESTESTDSMIIHGFCKIGEIFFSRSRRIFSVSQEFLSILSKVSRGSVEEKLQWVFGLYDLDGDGLISKEEMLDVVGSIYEMLGRYTQPQISEPQMAAREHVDRIFHVRVAHACSLQFPTLACRPAWTNRFVHQADSDFNLREVDFSAVLKTQRKC